MRVFMPVQKGHGLGHQSEALGMTELPFVGRGQNLQPDTEGKLQRQHPREEQSVKRRNGGHTDGRQPEVLFGVAECRFDPPAAPVPRHDLRRGPVGRRQQEPVGRGRLEATFEKLRGAPAQAGGDQRSGEAPSGTAADVGEPADLSRRKRELAERPTIPAMGDAPRLGQAHEIGPAVAFTPLQNGTAGEAAIAKEHRGEAGGASIGQEHMQLIEEGELEAGDLVAHGAVLVGVPQERDAAATAGQDGLEDAKLATGGGIDDHGQVRAMTGPPRERGVGEGPAQHPAVDAFILRPTPQLLVARIEVTGHERATGQVGEAQGALTEDKRYQQREGGTLLWQHGGPNGLDDGGE